MPHPLRSLNSVWFLLLFMFGLVLQADSLLGRDETPLQRFIESTCIDCHSSPDPSGGLDLQSLDTNLDNEAVFAQWERVFDRVSAAEMPPADVEVAQGQRQVFLNELAARLTNSHRSHKGTVLRRLNRQEYENTLNDLFGTNLRLAELLPEDGRSQEFSNIGASLNISSVQLEQYLNAMDVVLDTAIADDTRAPESQTNLANYAETREGEKHLGTAWHQAPDGAVVFFRRLGYPTGMLRTANTRRSGYYKIRVTGYAFQSDQPITFSVGATTFQRGAEKPTYGFYAFAPGTPQTVELTAWMEDRYMVEITPWGISDPDYLIKKHGIANYAGPGLAINHVELEGPLTSQFPSPGHQLLFDGIDRVEVEPSNPQTKQKSWYRPTFEIQLADKRDESPVVPSEIAQSIQRMATTAFRRPVAVADLRSFETLYLERRRSGETIESALRSVAAAVFCSPEFLFIVEPPGLLDDFALATRLSYFLSRTTPDSQLLALADAGRLSDPSTLVSQTRRLLAADNHDRFIQDFTDAWLNLREINFTNPDASLFPEYDAYLQHSMLNETRSFVAALIAENRPLTELLAPGFAMLNERLAQHYGIEGVRGPELRQVAIDTDSVRGGLLGQASVLKVSANGTNTSPVVRGVWVLERILGLVPPPPPAGIAGVEPDIRGATTLRELLDKHRDSDDCRVCHQIIDPPGFALESFDPIGGWRTRFRSLGEGEKVDLVIEARRVRYRLGPKVDASGQLPDGREFSGYHEFRDYLVEDADALAQAFATKLLAFGTGREMGFSDRAEIADIVLASANNQHRIRDLIELVVASSIFRSK